MTQTADTTTRTLRITPGAAGLDRSSEDAPPRARWGGHVHPEAAGDGPALQLRVRGGAGDLSVQSAAVRELAHAL
jgi:hypothetical protein